MNIEKSIPRYYKMSLFGVGSFFSLYERKQLQEGEYHIEETREIPIYKLEQKEAQISYLGINYEESYIEQKLKITNINACNSFAKDNFFYDQEEGLLFYMSTFIYAERKEDTYFDLVTGEEIPKYAIEHVEMVSTIDDYINLKLNVSAIVPYTALYQQQFMDILISNANRKNALKRLKAKHVLKEIEIMPEELQDSLTFEQLIDYKKEIVDSGIQDKIDSYMKKIGQKRR